jgi:hypothetical protein
VIEVAHKKFKKFKTLVLKLKPKINPSDLTSLTPDQLDQFVDETITDLQNTLLSNANHLRERIKQVRPDSNDTEYDEKMIVYQELLEQIISIMQKLQNIIGRTLDELHILVEQLWIDISQNNGRNIDRLLSEHAIRTNAYMQQMWIKDINALEATLNALN